MTVTTLSIVYLSIDICRCAVLAYLKKTNALPSPVDKGETFDKYAHLYKALLDG